MLDDYKDLEFYQYVKELKNYYHAYLFEVENIEDSYPLILAFAKMILCPKHYKNKNLCNDCNICHLITENHYEDFKLIEPNGMLIKKEQILDLQKSLSLKSIHNQNQVYIIKEADKLNLNAANSLLKFLEEPEPGIHAILITTSRNNILPTILSRCISFSLNSKRLHEYDIDIVKELIEFLALIYSKKAESIAYYKANFLDCFKTKEDTIRSFNILEFILDEYIHTQYEISYDSKNEIYDIIKKKLESFDRSIAISFLEIVIRYRQKLIQCLNLNLNLFIDRFIIDIARVIK